MEFVCKNYSQADDFISQQQTVFVQIVNYVKLCLIIMHMLMMTAAGLLKNKSGHKCNCFAVTHKRLANTGSFELISRFRCFAFSSFEINLFGSAGAQFLSVYCNNSR